MPFHFELHSDRPLLINVIDPGFRADELPAMADEANLQLGKLAQRVYYIVDLRDLRLNLGDIMQGARYGAQGISPPLHHPNIIEAMVITTDPLLRMAARGVDSHLFGNLKLGIFSTQEEALAYIDSRLRIAPDSLP